MRTCAFPIRHRPNLPKTTSNRRTSIVRRHVTHSASFLVSPATLPLSVSHITTVCALICAGAKVLYRQLISLGRCRVIENLDPTFWRIHLVVIQVHTHLHETSRKSVMNRIVGGQVSGDFVPQALCVICPPPFSRSVARNQEAAEQKGEHRH